MEWFQRAIYSKEEQGGMDKSPVCYINIGYILVESAKHEIDKLEHIKQKVCHSILSNLLHCTININPSDNIIESCYSITNIFRTW